MTSTAHADPELVTAAEAARLLGITRQRVLELADADTDGFPAATPTPTGGRAWPRAAIHAWAAAHPDPGPVFTGPEVPPDGRHPPQVGKVRYFASKAAFALNHPQINLDHLVLGMLHPDCPGAARAVLESFGASLEPLRQDFVDSLGDPYDVKVTHAEVPPATQLVLERANLEATRLADAEVTSEHVLLALTRTTRWREQSSATNWLARCGITAQAVRQRVVAVTEGVELPEPPAVLEPQPPRPDPTARLDLAPNPLGHDPCRRMPWSQMPFPVRVVPEGRPLRAGVVARGYFRDRDGYPVLTTDGRPIGIVLDEDGMPVLDEHGRHLFGPVEVSPGCEVTARQEPS